MLKDDKQTSNTVNCLPFRRKKVILKPMTTRSGKAAFDYTIQSKQQVKYPLIYTTVYFLYDFVLNFDQNACMCMLLQRKVPGTAVPMY